ncbi:MAG: radical SAM protein [Candidatus Gracilibacteria bacterium]|nr:radical SAM protein [Candidatus Gracilibacteria bacterium]
MLIVPNGTSPEGRDVRNHVPLGAISVLSEVKKACYDVLLLDSVGESRKQYYLGNTDSYFHDEEIQGDIFRKTGLEVEEILKRIAKEKPTEIGVSCLTIVDRSETLKLIRNIKKEFPNLPIILGGHEATQSYKEILGFGEYEVEKIPEVDYIVVGPGQPVVVKLLEYLRGNLNKDNLEGVAFVENGKLQFIPQFGKFNPDNYALPDYSLLPQVSVLGREKPIDIYSLIGNTHAGEVKNLLGLSNNEIVSYLALITSYGCGFSCTFCDNPPDLIRYSPENVIKMIEQFKDLYGVDYIDFMDNNFGGGNRESREIVFEILERLKGKNLNFGFSNGLTFESMAREDFRLLKALKSAGNLRHLAFPIENGNDRVLKMVKKPHTLKMVNEVLEAFKSIFEDELDHINREAFFIGGFPDTRGLPAETPEEVEKSIQLMEKLLKEGKLDQAIFLTLSPVTNSYRQVWRQKHPDGAFEKALFSKGTDLWPYGMDFIKSIHERVKLINQRYGKSSITRKL